VVAADAGADVGLGLLCRRWPGFEEGFDDRRLGHGFRAPAVDESEPLLRGDADDGAVSQECADSDGFDSDAVGGLADDDGITDDSRVFVGHLVKDLNEVVFFVTERQMDDRVVFAPEHGLSDLTSIIGCGRAVALITDEADGKELVVVADVVKPIGVVKGSSHRPSEQRETVVGRWVGVGSRAGPCIWPQRYHPSRVSVVSVLYHI